MKRLWMRFLTFTVIFCFLLALAYLFGVLD